MILLRFLIFGGLLSSMFADGPAWAPVVWFAMLLVLFPDKEDDR